MRRFLTFGPAFVVLLTVVAALLLVPTAIRGAQSARLAGIVDVAARELEGDATILEQVNAAVRAVARAVEPSVVHLDIEGSPTSSGSLGSGWIFDDLGHIVTNAHVVGRNKRVQVELFDGRVREASVVGADLDSDIAVVKIDDTQSIIPARRGSGERVERGDRVFAFGSPFGFKFSMSEGIVSGLGRTARTELGRTRISNFIQTDAAVNPGNSGGPLVNVRGRVIGMNVAIATAGSFQPGPEGEGRTSQGQSSGISFAIPLGTIESRVAQIIAGGPIQSGYIGVVIADRSTTSGFAARGVILSDVFEESPAQAAGLLPDDVIVSIDGAPVDDSQIFISMISAKMPGESARLRVQRAANAFDVIVTLIDRPRVSLARQYESRLEKVFGLVLEDRSGRLVVESVAANSLAATAGFEPGQSILGVGTNSVPSVASFMLALADSGLFRGRRARIIVTNSVDVREQRMLFLERSPSPLSPATGDGN